MEVLSLGEKVKKRRKELNMTLKDVAGNRVTPGQISLVESSKSNPSMDLLDYLADTLDISVEYFMESETTQADRICNYFSQMAEISIELEEFDKASKYIEKGDRYIEKYNLILPKARNLYLKGMLEIRKKNFTRAFDYLFQCNIIYSTHSFKGSYIDNFMLVAKTCMEQESLPMAISYFHKSEALFVEGILTDEIMLAKVYFYLAVAYKKIGNLEKSREYTAKANEKFEIMSDKRAYGQFLTRLAEKNELEGNFEEALKYSTMSLQIFHTFEEEEEMGEIELNLGILYEDFDEYQEAIVHYSKAENFYNKNQNKLSEVYLHMAECYAHLNKKEASYEILSYLDRMILEEDFSGNIKLYRVKSRIESIFKNTRGAVNNLILALNIAREKKLKEQESEIMLLMAKFYLEKGKNIDSYKLLEKSMEIMHQEGVNQ
ncbi:helix-turn-helix transcriptional regulator [Proteiniclasticum sp.]|uniref:helix-turn-helix transcriptional regulator n=1 Tax=Proteiniclasticum sp. TaxID=2053595 RepID=UPI00289A0AED|nr:helix-turn-helix transcriptional regulator [Proteiniclasticum sp.]